jgi:hypothetical protein
MNVRPPSTQLTLPFTIVGGAVGWLAARAFADPLVALSMGGNALVATSSAAIIGAGVGALLGRRQRARIDAFGTPVGTGFVLAVVTAGGALAGAATQFLMNRERLPAATLAGAVAGLLAWPICLVVLRAQERADRARHGSIVAAADRRATWSILAAALALTTVSAAPAWTEARDLLAARPWLAAAFWVASLAVIIAVLVLDRRAARSLRALGREGLEARDSADVSLTNEPAVRHDVGLGESLSVRVERRDAYRGAERVAALLVGDLATAKAELSRAQRRDGACLALAFGALAVHGAANLRGSLDAVRHARCDGDDMASCKRITENAIPREDLIAPIIAACDAGDSSACNEAWLHAEHDEGPLDPFAALFDRRCASGHGDDCHAKAINALKRGNADPAVAEADLGRACRLGLAEGCDATKLFTGHLATTALQHCAAGIPDECRRAAWEVKEYQNEKDLAHDLYARGCDLGNAAACYELGDEAWKDHSWKGSVPAARNYFERACTLGQALACCVAADTMAGSPDLPRMSKLIRRAASLHEPCAEPDPLADVR